MRLAILAVLLMAGLAWAGERNELCERTGFLNRGEDGQIAVHDEESGCWKWEDPDDFSGPVTGVTWKNPPELEKRLAEIEKRLEKLEACECFGLMDANDTDPTYPLLPPYPE